MTHLPLHWILSYQIWIQGWEWVNLYQGVAWRDEVDGTESNRGWGLPRLILKSKHFYERRRSQDSYILKVLELVMEIDTDGNGTIDFHEFINMMKKKSSETDQLEVGHPRSWCQHLLVSPPVTLGMFCWQWKQKILDNVWDLGFASQW